MLYQCIETFQVSTFQLTNYKTFYGNGTIVKDSIWELVRNPTPTKKLYKLKEIVTKNYEPTILYLRRSAFAKYFMKYQENQENNNKILCESCKWRVLYQTTQDPRVFFENCSQCYFDSKYENYEKNETSQ